MTVVTPENGVHQSVLLEPAIQALLFPGGMTQIPAGGIYIDATFGRGGHSRRILDEIGESSRLIAIDQDPEACEVGAQWQDPRFEMIYSSFGELEEMVRMRGIWGQVTGILFDLGVSSPQLDQSQRGFSFRLDGPLDMRMNSAVGISAKEWLATVPESELARVLKEYGEERFAKRIARSIVHRREISPLSTTKELADLVTATIPNREPQKHPATRTFQAIRIAVNCELEVLKKALAVSLDLLAPGGRMVVISFHSLEDRVVKQFFQDQHKGDHFPKDMPIRVDQLERRLNIVGKPVKPSSKEVQANIRARSAVMRVAEKL